MTRRRILLGVPIVVAAFLIGLWLLWPRTAITADNAAKIKNGMTLEQVVAILGGPERDESTGPIEADDPDIDEAVRTGREPPEAAVGRVELLQLDFPHQGMVEAGRYWKTDRLMVRIELDQDGRVSWILVQPVRRQHESLLNRLRRWLRL